MMAAEPEPRPAITKVWAKNFRSIEYAELELDPLTVLVGPNASGKSNLLDILGFLSDAARDGLESAINRRGGIDSIGRRTANGRVLGPEVGFRWTTDRDSLEYSLSVVRLGEGRYRVKREAAQFESVDHRGMFAEVELTKGRITKARVNSSQALKPTDTLRTHNKSNTPRSLAGIRDERFNDHNLQLLSDGSPYSFAPLQLLASCVRVEESANYYALLGTLDTASQALSQLRFYHIFPNSLRDPQKVADSHPLAPAGENLASALRDMIQSKNRFLRDLKHAMNYAVPGVSDIRVSRAGSFQVVELKHASEKGNGNGSWFDLSFESDGTIRLLAMLVALFQEPTPPIIGLEEPELAIHPGVMAVLAETMQETSLRGQVVVATHSPDLIDRLPVESIRAVSAESGSTKVGKVVPHQLKSVREGLFSAGELHGLMGLYPEDAGE
jgi:predicted ATPase